MNPHTPVAPISYHRYVDDTHPPHPACLLVNVRHNHLEYQPSSFPRSSTQAIRCTSDLVFSLSPPLRPPRAQIAAGVRVVALCLCRVHTGKNVHLTRKGSRPECTQRDKASGVVYRFSIISRVRDAKREISRCGSKRLSRFAIDRHFPLCF